MLEFKIKSKELKKKILFLFFSISARKYTYIMYITQKKTNIIIP